MVRFWTTEGDTGTHRTSLGERFGTLILFETKVLGEDTEENTDVD